MKSIYLISSLRNREETIHFANELEEQTGIEVFDSWLAPGPEADDMWKEYEQARGRTYEDALKGWAGTHIYAFDKYHIDRCDGGVLILPAGKSAHLELGYILGTGKPGWILMDEKTANSRWDVMLQFATEVCFSLDDLLEVLKK